MGPVFILQWICKPGSVSRINGIPVIYLSDLPPGNGRAILECRYTWSFNPQDERHGMLPSRPVSSYLTFSPFPRFPAEVIFCSVTMPSRTSHFRECGTLCCPDFPY